MPISESSFDHWMRISAATSGHSRGTPLIPHRFSPRWKVLRDQVMQFLISAKWLAGEAQRLGISVSEAAARRELVRTRDQSFSSMREYRRFLRSSGMRTPDLLYRIRLDLISNRIRSKVVAGAKTPDEQQQALDDFVRSFRKRWRAQTRCRPAYRTSDCGATL